MPYIYGQAVVAADEGIPVLRPMVAGVSQRPGLQPPGPAVHVRGSRLLVAPSVQRIRRDVVLHPGRHLDAPADRRNRTRPCLGPRGVRLPTRYRLRSPWNVLPIGRGRPAGLPYDEDVTLRAYEFPEGDRTTGNGARTYWSGRRRLRSGQGR